MLPRAGITGRFQPFHIGHWELLNIALTEAEIVFIGITNPDPASWKANASSAHRHQPESNPFTYWERQNMIQSALEYKGLQDRCHIVPFPLDRPKAWSSYIPLDAVQFVRVFTNWEADKVQILQTGGYPVRVIAGDPLHAVRATDIRLAWLKGDEAAWRPLLPDGVASGLPMRMSTT